MRVSTLFLVLILMARSDSAAIFADTEGSKQTLGPAVKHAIIGPGMNVRGQVLKGTQIVGYDLSGAIFDDADLSGARIFDCDLSNASFKNAILSGVVFSGTPEQVDPTQLEATWNFKNQQMDQISLPDWAVTVKK